MRYLEAKVTTASGELWGYILGDLGTDAREAERRVREDAFRTPPLDAVIELNPPPTVRRREPRQGVLL